MKTIKEKLLISFIFIVTTVFGTDVQAQSFQVLNPKVEQGSVLVFRIAPQWMPPAVQNPSIAIFGKHYLPNKYGEVFIGIDKSIAPGKHMATLVEYGRGVRLSWNYEEVEVVERNFAVRIRSPGAPRNSREAKAIDSAYKNGNKFEKHFDGKFVRPLDFIVVGKDRTIGDISVLGQFGGESHRGVDLITLDPKTGKHQRPVKAINSGKIVLVARNFSLEGNMIIIDHGSGVFSIYMHLSKFNVKQGELVKTGQIIGISGRTGRTNKRPGAPHLHFGVRVGDPTDSLKFTVIDPLVFIDTMNQYLE